MPSALEGLFSVRCQPLGVALETINGEYKTLILLTGPLLSQQLHSTDEI
jgi:hypothetical protein